MAQREANAVVGREYPKTRPKVTAPQYVSKMQLPPDKAQLVVELADRFEVKGFLPTWGDISNFCKNYGIDQPASKSRTNAIPRLFKFIASMETDEIQRIIRGGWYSGPSRLGPIADAIRGYGRTRAVQSFETTEARPGS